MIRKKREKKHKEDGSERWLVSYADMLTLLLGLFVVLYASKQDGVSETVVQESVVQALQDKESSVLRQFSQLPVLFEKTLGVHVEKNEVSIDISNKYIEVIVFNDNIFEVGSAQLNYKSTEPLYKISQILKNTKHVVVIEGHTDSSPIAGGLYASNWELSASRSAAVLRFFERQGLSSEKMSVVGFGSKQPVYANGTSEGRSKNRRVVVKILRDF